jgi:hypothetical protein
MNGDELANGMTRPRARRIGTMLAVVPVVMPVMLTLAGMPASASNETAAVPAQRTVVARWYTDANYKGDTYTEVEY